MEGLETYHQQCNYVVLNHAGKTAFHLPLASNTKLSAAELGKESINPQGMLPCSEIFSSACFQVLC